MALPQWYVCIEHTDERLFTGTRQECSEYINASDRDDLDWEPCVLGQ